MRRRRHLTLITTPPPDERVLVLNLACCQALAVLRDGQVFAVYHDGDDHMPDAAGIERELARHRGDTVPDPHRFDRQSVKHAQAEQAMADERSRAISDLRAALIQSLTPTDPDDQPDDPPRGA